MPPETGRGSPARYLWDRHSKAQIGLDLIHFGLGSFHSLFDQFPGFGKVHHGNIRTHVWDNETVSVFPFSVSDSQQGVERQSPHLEEVLGSGMPILRREKIYGDDVIRSHLSHY